MPGSIVFVILAPSGKWSTVFFPAGTAVGGTAVGAGTTAAVVEAGATVGAAGAVVATAGAVVATGALVGAGVAVGPQAAAANNSEATSNHKYLRIVLSSLGIRDLTLTTQTGLERFINITYRPSISQQLLTSVELRAILPQGHGGYSCHKDGKT
jgi:hypothetical protein